MQRDVTPDSDRPVLYDRWPELGCTLAEARERTIDFSAHKRRRDLLRELEGLGPEPNLYLDAALADWARHDERAEELKRDLRRNDEEIDANFRQLMRAG